MLGLSLLVLGLGTVLAAASAGHPSHRPLLEWLAGTLLVGGLGLIGLGLPIFR